MPYTAFIPTTVSLNLPLAASRIQKTQKSRETAMSRNVARLKRFNGYKIPVIAPFLIPNTSKVFICAIHNFDPDYCLFGFASSGLQNTEYAKITRTFDFFFHKVGKGGAAPEKNGRAHTPSILRVSLQNFTIVFSIHIFPYIFFFRFEFEQN